MFTFIENILLGIRNFFWRYPDFLFTGPNSFFGTLSRVYRQGRPLSHVLAAASIVLIIIAFGINNVAAVLNVKNDEYIEGIVTGVDEDGNLRSVKTVNPLIPPIVQLERDLNEVIYESLVSLNPDGSINKVLLEDYDEVQPGKKYKLYLKQGVIWQDDEDFNADDVIETHRLLEQLNSRASTQSSFSKSAVKMKMAKIDDFTIEVTIDGILPNFFEVMRYKILPEHLIKDITADNINSVNVKINTNPVGTGAYKFLSARAGTIFLTKFEGYYGEMPTIRTLRFVSFKDEESALDAVKSGQIHGLAGISSQSLESLEDYENVETYKSSTLYNQYWGLYFNLREEGPGIFKDKSVRQAIAFAIDKEKILEAISGQGEIASGPIPKLSFVYTGDVATYNFDLDKASELLTKAGWEGEIRKRGEEELKFTLTYVDNPDRNKIAEQIKSDLSKVGIVVELNPKSLTEVTQDYILPRRYEMLLYGVSTFIDPDRYELFHSAESEHPGLNIAGYTSEKLTKRVKEGKLIDVPEVDAMLDEGRTFANQDARKERYVTFQEVVANEVPIIFLYHPTYTYAVNQRVQGVELTNVISLEDRFLSLKKWKIVL